ncbi:hypothetical protein [Pseudoduganella chitinolytica]|uniref:Uncharacterized protein n=1 Tax=Pseudoduganella chitinolytica TaxID=34070 RepID=A0ABY8BCA3_9BURK|nr:hypothetical protein [Pseudoduganella chitinolytica]WEF33541.1 hypothetical protein PX653_01745 [Pseudoduganella chitinolytica]
MNKPASILLGLLWLCGSASAHEAAWHADAAVRHDRHEIRAAHRAIHRDRHAIDVARHNLAHDRRVARIEAREARQVERRQDELLARGDYRGARRLERVRQHEANEAAIARRQVSHDRNVIHYKRRQIEHHRNVIELKRREIARQIAYYPD